MGGSLRFARSVKGSAAIISTGLCETSNGWRNILRVEEERMNKGFQETCISIAYAFFLRLSLSGFPSSCLAEAGRLNNRAPRSAGYSIAERRTSGIIIIIIHYYEPSPMETATRSSVLHT